MRASAYVTLDGAQSPRNTPIRRGATMARRVLRAVIVILGVITTANVPAGTLAAAQPYIVILNDGNERGPSDSARVSRSVHRLENRHGIAASAIFGAVGSFAARLTDSQRRALDADPAISDVVPDVAISLDDE